MIKKVAVLSLVAVALFTSYKVGSWNLERVSSENKVLRQKIDKMNRKELTKTFYLVEPDEVIRKDIGVSRTFFTEKYGKFLSEDKKVNANKINVLDDHISYELNNGVKVDVKMNDKDIIRKVVVTGSRKDLDTSKEMINEVLKSLNLYPMEGVYNFREDLKIYDAHTDSFFTVKSGERGIFAFIIS